MAKVGTYLLAFIFTLPIWGQSPKARVYCDTIAPHWFDSNRKFWYRNDLPDGRQEFILVHAEIGERWKAFDHRRIAQILAEKMGKEVNEDRLPVESLRFSPDAKRVQLIGKDTWVFNLEDYSLSDEIIADADPPAEERQRSRSRASASGKSPDEKKEVLVRGHNLFLKEGETTRQVTHDGNPNHTYQKNVQRERFVEMRYKEKDDENPSAEVYWSPDSRYFVAMRTRPGTERTVYMVESSPQDQLQPKLQSYPYAKPGDEIPMRKPRLFEADSGREITIDDRLFANPWSIGDVRWDKDSRRFTFLFNQRGHQILRIMAINAETGEAKIIINEESATFIDYSGKFYSEYLDDTSEIVWMSERDGWNHLYLYDSETGEVKHQITKGEWVVRGVDRVDSRGRKVWFRASGVRAGQGPYFIHYCRANLDGSDFTLLTEGNGTHRVTFSPDRRYFIDTWSRVDLPPVNELRNAQDGSLVCALEEADAGELRASGWTPPESFVAQGRDGETDIYGVIHRPPDFDKQRKYPVIESIYAGPHGSFVPKEFRASYGLEKLTRRGFVVVQMDGMGTSNRSKKFHDICWKNIADAGFPDRILWIKAAAQKYPYLDLERIGIYGTSAGAQSALGGLLMHGDFYKAGVADCGCHDNRMDKIWWNEQWMGWPVGPHYDEQSNVTQAHRLQGKLLLMVGELDQNVDPASTMQVVNALIKADKDFEMLVMPGAGHGVARTTYGWKRLEEFFVRHLNPGIAP